MKIAFLAAVPFSLIFGGGETQLINTMSALRKKGAHVDYFDHWDRNFTCDILHIFGCHYWAYHFAMLAKAKGIRIALSTISYNPDPGVMYTLWQYVDPFIPVDTTFRLNRKLTAIADVVLPNSHAEAAYLEKYFRVEKSRTRVIPNATDLRYATARPEPFVEKYGLTDFVLCVGKIEPRKNQLNLVKALAGTGVKLVLIGSAIPQKVDYYNKVLDLVSSEENFYHIESLPHDSDLLASAYAAAKVHALLGENETPGIVNLEAGLAGANLVVAECPPVREYLGDHAFYCDGNSLDDIRRVISRALDRARTATTREFIVKNYTWEIAAERTLDAYKTLL
jgi:glycosyltransferase involved in cell wall biosynthesis